MAYGLGVEMEKFRGDEENVSISRNGNLRRMVASLSRQNTISYNFFQPFQQLSRNKTETIQVVESIDEGNKEHYYGYT